jgi:hypothetical protein
MSTKDFEVEEGNEIVGRTIVGGRPASHRKRKLRVPIGIEKVLVRAAVDEDFRKQLLEDRDGALADLGDELTPTERTVLSTIPNESLLQMVTNIDIGRHGKKRFMRGVVNAVLMTSAASAALSCGVMDSQTMGCTDYDAPNDIQVEEIDSPLMDIKGSQPDMPPEVEDIIKSDSQEPDVIEFTDLPAPGGILPDMDEQD